MMPTSPPPSRTIRTKKIICLANSRKLKGRCIAGIEISDAQDPVWIRPVTTSPTGEIPEIACAYSLGQPINVLDVLEVRLVESRAKGYQQENWLIDQVRPWTHIGRAVPADIEKVISRQPTVNRTAEQRKSSIPTDELNAEILRHLDKSLSSSALWREYFGRVHIAPTNGSEVPEEDSVGLVVLGPEWPRVAGGQDSAHKIASDILKDRSGGPRQNRNMLVFLAADEARLAEAREAAGWLLAWQWVCQQADDRVLVLDAAQIRTSQAQRETWTRSLTSAINDAYIWALDPTQTNDAPGIELHEIRLMGGSDLYVRIGKKLAESERLLVKYSGSRLQLLLQEERLKGVWNEHGGVKISALQETFTRFPYMPRIRDLSVLEAAMSDCVSGLLLDSGFGYAEGWDTQKATWHGVRHGVGTITDRHTGYLLQAEIAKELLPNTSAEADPPSSGVSRPIANEGVALRRYRARFSTSADNFSRLASDIGQELLPHLAGTLGSSVDIVVEVSALSPQGFSEKVLKTVSQNATELKSDVSEFHD